MVKFKKEVIKMIKNNAKQKIIDNIKDNYEQMEKSIVEQLKMRQDIHGTTIGIQREKLWEQVFEMLIPKKFVIEHSIFIIDSDENISHDVDLAVIDEMYTPYIFKYGKLKFVPIEAVAIVIECKSTEAKRYPTSIYRWWESIHSLRTNSDSIYRIATGVSIRAPQTQSETRPITILCANDSVNKKYNELFDFILVAKLKKDKLEIRVNSEKTLYEWLKSLCKPVLSDKATDWEVLLKKRTLADFEIKSHEGNIISLLTLNYQLNQLLMLINNPMPFPHNAYAERFKR